MKQILNKNSKILVGMSGGVDSSVTTLLLKKQGYDVIGAFIKNWSEEVGKKQMCWVDDRRDAMKVAALLDVPFVTFDFEKDFRKHVVDYLYCEYEAGRTPNPDIMCNKMIKFPMLIREAKKLGINYIATGHYVKLQENKNKQERIYELCKAKDLTKDQSYFLYTLNQDILKHCLFPLGDLTKKEVRKIAEENKIPTAKKPDSQGICFVGELNMRDFLSKRLSEKHGKIKTLDGKVIGEHKGLFFYTIGQREGIGIGGRAKDNKPLYVLKKDLVTNTLVVGPDDSAELFTSIVNLENVSWISADYEKQYSYESKISVKVRYRAPDSEAELGFKNNKYGLKFKKPERAVTPGQSAVFYDQDKMLGGGIIQSVG